MNYEVDIALIKQQLEQINSKLSSLNNDINTTSARLEEFIKKDFRKLYDEQQQRRGVIEFLKYLGVGGLISAAGLWLQKLGYFNFGV